MGRVTLTWTLVLDMNKNARERCEVNKSQIDNVTSSFAWRGLVYWTLHFLFILGLILPVLSQTWAASTKTLFLLISGQLTHHCHPIPTTIHRHIPTHRNVVPHQLMWRHTNNWPIRRRLQWQPCRLSANQCFPFHRVRPVQVGPQ